MMFLQLYRSTSSPQRLASQLYQKQLLLQLMA
jgi:hypothetical protein